MSTSNLLNEFQTKFGKIEKVQPLLDKAIKRQSDFIVRLKADYTVVHEIPS